MESPYQNRPSRSFWRSGVSEAVAVPPDLYQPKFRLDRDARIMTAGSCFAQHIGRALRRREFAVMDAEPVPGRLKPEAAQAFGYGIYSARYGNIYTVRQLLQLAQEALGCFAPANAIWEKNGRFIDALRPAVEPEGLASVALVQAHRAYHIARVRELLEQAHVLIFTLGLTECWEDRASGTVFPTAPGTIGGNYDPARYAFRNFDYADVRDDFVRLRLLLQKRNPNLRFILTVSPVPLAATATEDHVLVATTYSKAVLRAAAGALATEFADVDYFPSFEIVTGSPSKASFYAPDLRQVLPAGVDAVMKVFFAGHGVAGAKGATAQAAHKTSAHDPTAENALMCEEAMLEAFAR